jgi:hypothetical protein
MVPGGVVPDTALTTRPFNCTQPLLVALIPKLFPLLPLLLLLPLPFPLLPFKVLPLPLKLFC